MATPEMAKRNAWRIVVSPSGVFRYLIITTLLLTVVSSAVVLSRFVVGPYPGYRLLERVFSLDKEFNVPTLYNAGLAAFTSVLIWRVSVVDRCRRGRWTALALLAGAVAVDEILQIHEAAVLPLRSALGVGGFLHFAWLVPAMVVLAIIIAAYAPFLLRMREPARVLFLGGFALYVAGAIGMEAVGGTWVEQHGELNAGYVLITTAEESLEMIGLSVVAYGLLRYLTAFTTDLAPGLALSGHPMVIHELEATLRRR